MGTAKTRKNYTPSAVLDHGWSTFSKAIPKMTEQELRQALDYEWLNAKRPSYLVRLHTKYNAVRYRNERAAYGLAGVKV